MQSWRAGGEFGVIDSRACHPCHRPPERPVEAGRTPGGQDPTDEAPVQLRWWSPLPPSPGALATQSAMEVGALAGASPRTFDWAVVVSGRPGEVSVPSGLAVRAARAIGAGDDGGRGVLDIYHLGRDERAFAFVHASLFERPGVLVVHDDLTLEDFGPGRLGALALEVAAGVVVRSARLAAELSERFPTRRIVSVPYWLPLVPCLLSDAVSGPEQSMQAGAEAGDDRSGPGRPLVVGVIGCLEDTDAPAVATEALLALPAGLRRQVRVKLTGTVRAAVSLESLRTRLRAGGCVDALEVTLGLTGLDLVRAVRASDVVLSLPAGEVSGPGPVATWAHGLGLPVAVPEIAGGFGEDGIVWPLPAGSPTLRAEALAARLEELLVSRETGGVVPPRGGRDTDEWAALSEKAARGFVETCRELLESETPTSAVATDVRPRVSPTLRRPRPLRVRAIGDFAIGNGLSEAARRLTAAIEAAGLEVRREQVCVSPGPTEAGHGFASQPAWLDSDVTLCFVNVTEMTGLSEEVLRPSGERGYAIGSWYWELPALASGHRASVGRVDEVWVATRYVGQAFAGLVEGPVRVVPPPVVASETVPPPRRSLGLPDDGLVYLFHFDCMSTFARKNPGAVVAAFRQAFGVDGLAAGPPRAHLVVKARHLRSFDAYAAAAAQLERAVRAVGGTLIEEDLTADETSWLVRSCDVYVSLHRSEGFGLGLAEAMLAAKPVVATGYSGNLDFMTGDTSCLVGFRLREIVPEELVSNPGIERVYEAGQLWAEPDVRQAAAALRRLHQSPYLRRRLGSGAKRAIERLYSPARVGAVAARALEDAAARARLKAHSGRLKAG